MRLARCSRQVSKSVALKRGFARPRAHPANALVNDSQHHKPSAPAFGLRPLMNDSGMGAEAAFLLYVSFMTTFGGLVCAAAVMFPPKDDSPRGGLRGNLTSANWRPRLRSRRRGSAGPR
jgi:hypothetical protein